MLEIAISTAVSGASIGEQARKQLSLSLSLFLSLSFFLSLISSITLHFNSSLLYVTSDTDYTSMLKIFDAEVMINGEGFTQQSGTA